VIGDSGRVLPLDEDGLTLVEVVFAVAILGVALVGLGIVIPVSTHGIHEGQQLSTAAFLAEQTIERARAVAWTAAPPLDCLGLSDGDAPPVPTSATCYGQTTTGFPDEAEGVGSHPAYQRTVRVTSCAATPCAGVTSTAMRLVEVSVAYAPLTSTGIATSRKTIRLAWLASQK
jgi:prepilin-type N-terminal cleavage/methylation domain-containing protein